jgi:iron complex outermembrane receptor protein
MRTNRWLACVLTVALVFGSTSQAAAQATGASLQGTVRDESGGAVPGAVVTARHGQTGAATRVVSDAEGAYTFRSLATGTYTVDAVLPGFRHRPSTVTLAATAGPVLLDLVLEIAPLAETVVVTRAEQELSIVPQAVGVISQDDVQVGQRRTSLAETLRAVPGLFVQDRGNLSESNGLRLSVRAPVRGVGIGIRGLQVVQDDVPMTMADGTTQVSNIDLGSAERIEIIRGPSAVLYGNSAGGAMTIVTESPSDRLFVLQPDIQVGSDGYQRQQIKTSGTAYGVGYLVSASRMAADGFRKHSRAEVRQVNATVRARPSAATTLRAVFSVADMPFSESPSTLTREQALSAPRSVRQLAIDQGFGESSTQGQGGVTVERRFASSDVVRVTGWGMWRSVWNPIPFRIVDIGRTGSGFRTEYRGSTRRGSVPVTWTAGMDAAWQRDNRAEYDNAGVGGGDRAQEGAILVQQRETVRSLAPFAQVSIAPRPRWMITAGARFDRYAFAATDTLLSDGDQSGRRQMQAFSPAVGVTFEARPGLHVYGNVATAYETPTSQELSNRPSGEGGFNPDLEAESLRSVEGGVRGLIRRWRLTYDVTAYVSALRNALVRFERDDEQEFYRNAGAASRDGVEAQLDWTPDPSMALRLAYTWQRFAFDRFVDATGDFSGNREPGAPPHQLFAGATWKTTIGVTSTAQFRWVDAYPVNNQNTVSNWASRVMDLRFAADRTWTSLAIRPFLGIDNVFDERYNGSTVPNAVGNRFFEPSPGRVFYVGLTLDTGVR